MSRIDLSHDYLALAPEHFARFRDDAFRGETSRASLHNFTSEDCDRLHLIYLKIRKLLTALSSEVGNTDHAVGVFTEFAPIRQELTELTSGLGATTLACPHEEHVAQVVHDLRGGALQAFLLRWEMFSILPHERKGLGALYFLLRDHAKIMRNCVVDIDPARFEADARHHDHSAELLLQKWSHADYYGTRVPAHIDFNCDYRGVVCESCLEFSTLDRMIYNLINNASRYADDGCVRFDVLPLPGDGHPQNLRFVFANRVSPEHRERVESALPDLGRIFLSHFTTGGHGLGLRIVADFCTQAYGLEDDETARQSGYFGARWIDDNFVAWFHWPVPRN